MSITCLYCLNFVQMKYLVWKESEKEKKRKKEQYYELITFKILVFNDIDKTYPHPLKRCVIKIRRNQY